MKKIINTVKKRWYLILPAISIIIFIAYKNVSSKQTGKVSTYTVTRKNLKETLSLSGAVDAEEKASLKFQTAGMLAAVGVKEGDYVNKNQWIASLDKKELQAGLKRYLNTFSSQRIDFDQQQDNYKDQAVTEEMQRVLDKNQNDLNNTVIDVELKDIALKYSDLYTPIEGIVTKINTPNPGVNIIPATDTFEIVNPKTVFFSATADQTEVINLMQNMPAEITLDAYPEKKISGAIYYISFSPKQGETDIVYNIKVKLNDNNDDYKYRLGMTGDITFNLRELENILVVPASSIKNEEDRKYVWQAVDGKRKKTYVETGEEIDSDTEVTSGLKEGDIIYD